MSTERSSPSRYPVELQQSAPRLPEPQKQGSRQGKKTPTTGVEEEELANKILVLNFNFAAFFFNQ